MYSKFPIHKHFFDRGTVSQMPFDSGFKPSPQASTIFPLPSRWLALGGMFIFLFLGLNSVAHSGTYYLSPSGSNDNLINSSDKPWQTFKFAIPKLQPGDTLILKNGTYDQSNSGYPAINCRSGATNGTSFKPITIKAENERKAFLNVDGSKPAFRMENCSNWIIEGLRAKSADNPKKSTPVDVFFVRYSKNLMFKRLLVTHNNRYVNSQLLLLWDSSNILVEESEFYSFQRHAIALTRTNNSEFRRNYSNSREYGDISGGFKSINSKSGDNLVTIYPGSNNIVENNISEGDYMVTDIQATGFSVGNKILGNISLNDVYGLALNARGNTADKMPKDTLIENHVAINPKYFGIIVRSSKNTQILNASTFGGRIGVVADIEAGRSGDGIAQTYSKNVLVMGHSSYGIKTADQQKWSHGYVNSYNNEVNFNLTKNVTHATTLNPGFGNCKVFVPESSPLKGKGEGGVDIGANILYRYEKGQLNNQPLWNAKTGEFPHGAMVPGVNDIAGSSPFDVHKRLNVNANGCALPKDYGKTGETDLTPKNLKVLVSG